MGALGLSQPTASVYLLPALELVIRSLILETGTCLGKDKKASKKITLTVEERNHKTVHLAGPCNHRGANSTRPKSPKVPWITVAWSWAN